MSEIKISELVQADAERWDAFVQRCSEATFFHRAGWKEVIEQSFGHQTHFLFAERDGAIGGVLPLGHVDSLLFGNNLVSLPFCVYGGIAAENDEVRAALQQAACALADRLGVGSLEMRNLQSRNENWPTKGLHVTFRKEIDVDPEVNMMAIPRKQRAMVRKGIKAGLVGELDDGCDRLYQIYAESVRNLGTPVFSKKYLNNLRRVFGDACEVLMITHEGKDIAGVMSFYFRDEVLPYYGGSVTAARAVKGNDFMYWDLMRRAGERGVRIFDYGRSKRGTGPYSFKKNWGFTPEPLHYEYYLVKAKAMPEINPTNPKYQLFIRAWKKLPLPIAKVIGPLLAKDLG